MRCTVLSSLREIFRKKNLAMAGVIVRTGATEVTDFTRLVIPAEPRQRGYPPRIYRGSSGSGIFMAVVVKRAGRILKIEIPIGKPERIAEGSCCASPAQSVQCRHLRNSSEKAIFIDLTVFIDTDERDEYNQRARLNMLQIEGKLRCKPRPVHIFASIGCDFSESGFEYAPGRTGRRSPVKKRAAIYLRCSTGRQEVGMQERELRQYAARRGWGVQQVYRDEGVSGADASRPGLNALMQDCQRGHLDVVLVWKFDRFARSLTQLVNALAKFKQLGIDFVSSTEQIDTALPQGELVFGIFGAVAQFEKSLISERVKAGLMHARHKGKRLGRPALRRLTPAETAELRRDRRAKRLSFRDLAGKYGVSLWTAHRLCAGKG